MHFLVIHLSENSFKFYSRNIQLYFFPRSLFSILKQFGKVKFKFKGTLDTVYSSSIASLPWQNREWSKSWKDCVIIHVKCTWLKHFPNNFWNICSVHSVMLSYYRIFCSNVFCNNIFLLWFHKMSLFWFEFLTTKCDWKFILIRIFCWKIYDHIRYFGIYSFFYIAFLAEADLGLLQHPRWIALW